MNIDIWSALILVFVAQGVFTLSVLLFSSERRKVLSNRYLCALILLMIWILIEFLSIRNAFKIDINIFYGTRYGIWFAMGPCVFYYYKSVTDKNWTLHFKSLLHLLPFIVFVVAIPLISNESLSSRQIHYGMLAVFDYRPKTVTPFEYIYSTVFYLQFIHVGVYLLYSFKIIKGYTRRLKAEYSSINDILWLKVFAVLLLLTLLFASIYLYILFASDAYTRELDYIYVVPMGVFIYSIGYRLSGINWLAIDIPIQKYATSSLKKEMKLKALTDLEILMDKEKVFLKNDLRLQELAQKLAISSHHLSQLINEHYGCSFYDFINRNRIHESKILIQSHPEKNLLQIAFDAGFNNKTSFVNAFKKFENKTPSVYRKEL